MGASEPIAPEEELDRLARLGAARDLLGQILAGQWGSAPGTVDAIARLVASANNVLDRPTLGAVCRAQGHTGMCEEARIALAWEIVQEARRWWIFDRLESILVGLTRLADPDVIARRLRRLADLVDGGRGHEEERAA